MHVKMYTYIHAFIYPDLINVLSLMPHSEQVKCSWHQRLTPAFTTFDPGTRDWPQKEQFDEVILTKTLNNNGNFTLNLSWPNHKDKIDSFHFIKIFLED